ncbi:hypothetical protein EGW08_007237 [Elysia chlorotica]|uniref:Uncharacterized protein n=1 Tax=Elysia chlorotica TaxID=188477 RepID=A0A3S1BJ48_ELYCH|nr:hypothetical protein EGW08_007237 [Elysia chlorotica]
MTRQQEKQSKGDQKEEIWDSEDLATVRIKVLQGHTDSANSCQFIEHDKVLSSSSDCSVRIWNWKTRKCLKCYENLHKANIPQASATQDGKKFITCGWDKQIKYWDSETGQNLLEKTENDFLTCCQLSHDGNLVAVGSDLSKSLRVYDLRSGDLIHFMKNYHGSGVTSVKFCPEDDKVITTSMDKTAKFYDLISGKSTIKLEGHTNVISSCAITGDERKFATASWDKSIRLWDVATGMYRSKGPSTMSGGHDGSISCCQFSGDGLFLVTGSYDMSIVVWDVENNVQKLKLQGHYGWINDVAFSEDQNWLLSCSKDCTVRLWNIEESDKIPIVLENKKSVGIKVIKCSKCGKPFSMAQMESFRDVTVCVFCRLSSPEKPWLSFTDTPETTESAAGSSPA